MANEHFAERRGMSWWDERVDLRSCRWLFGLDGGVEDFVRHVVAQGPDFEYFRDSPDLARRNSDLRLVAQDMIAVLDA